MLVCPLELCKDISVITTSYSNKHLDPHEIISHIQKRQLLFKIAIVGNAEWHTTGGWLSFCIAMYVPT